MAGEESNGFLEYLQLQGGSPDMVTKSELIARIRDRGFSLSSRQLTFYVTEGLVPHSVRIGTRMGAYPAIVVPLLSWIVAARDAGVSIEALKELLPVWKSLIRAYHAKTLDLGELEYVARQHITSVEGSMVVPRLVNWIMSETCCADCQTGMEIIYKDGSTKSILATDATIGFAIARADDETEADGRLRWYASTRLTLGHHRRFSTDPTTVILGVKPNAELPQDDESADGGHQKQEATTRP